MTFSDLLWTQTEIGCVNVLTHEWQQREILYDLLPNGGVFLDVGAHVGTHSLALALKASRVVAVEPNPNTADMLRANIALNGLANVEVVQVAAWDRTETLAMHNPQPQTGDTSGWARTLPTPDYPHWADPQPVRGVRLDEALTFDRLDLVKVDVEGADLHALAGMARLLHLYQPTMLIEGHDIHGYYHMDELTTLVEQLGYTWEYSTHCGAARFLLCRPA